MLLKRLTKFFISLRLTVVLLAFAIILIWVGTVAQADEGLYQAQTRYFKQWIVLGASMFGHRVPLILPGGYLLGTMLLVNLLAAHIARFQFTWKKLGIHVAHAGIILLLVGQLATDMFSHEMQIRFSEGQSRSYAESMSDFELVFTTDADAIHNQEVAIPGRMLAKGGEINVPQLPFSVRLKNYWHNSVASFRAPMMQNGPALTTNGVAVDFDFGEAPDVKTLEEKNVPTAVIELVAPTGSLGEWVASGWSGDESAASLIWEKNAQELNNPQMANAIYSRIVQPQTVEAAGKQYNFKLRPARVYTPYSLTLLKMTNSFYPGSETPKDFRSRVRLQNKQTGEDREVEIFMNNPLRYGGLTFYQYQMNASDIARQAGHAASALQVVRNPGWFTPYVGCILVALGLVIQFMSHLIKFISKRKAATVPPPVPNSPKAAEVKNRALQEAVRK
jgi:hypothetical protein